MDGGNFVVAPIGDRSFVLSHCFSNLVFNALSRSAIILLRKTAGCFTLKKPWLSVSIPHGAMGRSAVCDCDIFWSYSLVESICLLAIQIAPSI